ncbi:unnamed protein product [Mytilus coruscus]|uniref:Mutator-like transposase domain-containing protein n=1 Tax=Mytilus coruscus TaxID=42192 RepID=A0A6J8A467_MYTCO|nr:unnamed protein product [Mytilus coruscus]
MEGRRVVELDVMAREMYCCRCNLPLHLSNTVGERLYGLASVLLIKCDNSACLATTDVHTGKRTPNGSYCINSKVAIGMTHAGMGPSHVNNFLTECNLPPISDTTLRKKEKEFSKTIHDVAMTSCREAQHQEILLSHGKIFSNNDPWVVLLQLCYGDPTTSKIATVDKNKNKLKCPKLLNFKQELTEIWNEVTG